jgi:DNA-directed RNA polymerase subunit M/transcription elongation factor TFIIS
MKFCPECQNFLYSIEEEDGNAVLNCRKCDYKEKLSRDDAIVYEHVLKEDKSAKYAINPYLKLAPELPRFTEIVCPNAECPSKRGVTPDVVGLKIDATNLVWMYQCANCDLTWKQNAGLRS